MEDKILNNSYNTGERNFEEFTFPIRIDDKISSQYEDQLSDNLVEHRVIKMLEEIIYKLFEKSPFFQKYKNPKRVDKSDLLKIYYYFKDMLLKEKTFSNMEIFIGIAEFFQINYEQLYTEIGVLDKEQILKELNKKYGLMNKIKSKRLF